MRRFTVVCHPTVENHLAQLLLENWGTPLFQQLSTASSRIDTELANRPLDVGEEVSPGLRYVVVLPLLVEYRVNEGDRKVTLICYRWHE